MSADFDPWLSEGELAKEFRSWSRKQNAHLWDKYERSWSFEKLRCKCNYICGIHSQCRYRCVESFHAETCVSVCVCMEKTACVVPDLLGHEPFPVRSKWFEYRYRVEERMEFHYQNCEGVCVCKERI